VDWEAYKGGAFLKVLVVGKPALSKAHREGRKKDNLDSVEPTQRRADQLPRRGRPPRRCILKQIDDACFPDTDGKLVSALVMQAVKDVAAFLECSHSTISKAMAQTDERKGIVFNIWKVEEYTNREADEDVHFPVQNEQDSCHDQQPHIKLMASTLNYACTHELATIHGAVCVNDLASSHPEQYMTLASSPKELYSHQSEMTDRYATPPNELFLEVSDSPSHLKPSNVSKSKHNSYQLSGDSTNNAASRDVTSMTKLSQDDIQFQEASTDEDLARRLTHYIQSDMPQLTPHPAALDRACAIERHKGSLKTHSKAKLYNIRRDDGQYFDFEGKSVPSAMICSNRSVIALTGISLRTLQYAQQNTDILWDPWRITYLKMVHLNHNITQDLLRETSVLSSQLGSDSNQLREGPVRDISLTSSKQGSSLGTKNQLEQWQSSNEPASMVLVPSEHNLPSTDSIILADGFQSSDITGVIGSREKTVLHTRRRKRASHSVATRMKMQKNAVNRNQSISDTTRARMSDHAHQHLVERVNGTSFDYNGQPVHFAIIPSRLAASKFLACDYKTISRAQQKRGKQKGIVKRIWRVRDLGRPIRSA
jgi:hypothetical protein